MNEENQFDDELKRKRELDNARVKEHRKKMRSEAEKLNSMTHDEPNDEFKKNEQIAEKSIEHQRQMSRERSRRYRERKRLNALISIDLQNEFKSLSLNGLQTVTDMLTEFISNTKGISIYSFNCQSLQSRNLDIDDNVTQRSTILLLSKIWLNNEENIDVPNFHYIAKFKRPDCRTAGVAVFRNNRGTTNLVSLKMDVTFGNSQSYGFNRSSVGEICIAECKPENEHVILMIAIYISPDQSINKIIEFIHENLLIYTEAGSTLLKQNLHKLPMILSGDFNVDFSSDESKPLIDFLKLTLNLNMSNDPYESTTKHEPRIDGVFFRYLNRFQSKAFISYFSYHKPMLSFVDCGRSKDDQSEEYLSE